MTEALQGAAQQIEALELLTLPQAPSPAVLAQLLATQGGAQLSARAGQDAQGQVRSVIEIRHADPELVAQTRQNLLRACQQARVRAFVV